MSVVKYCGGVEVAVSCVVADGNQVFKARYKGTRQAFLSPWKLNSSWEEHSSRPGLIHMWDSSKLSCIIHVAVFFREKCAAMLDSKPALLRVIQLVDEIHILCSHEFWFVHLPDIFYSVSPGRQSPVSICPHNSLPLSLLCPLRLIHAGSPICPR